MHTHIIGARSRAELFIWPKDNACIFKFDKQQRHQLSQHLDNTKKNTNFSRVEIFSVEKTPVQLVGEQSPSSVVTA